MWRNLDEEEYKILSKKFKHTKIAFQILSLVWGMVFVFSLCRLLFITEYTRVLYEENPIPLFITLLTILIITGVIASKYLRIESIDLKNSEICNTHIKDKTYIGEDTVKYTISLLIDGNIKEIEKYFERGMEKFSINEEVYVVKYMHRCKLYKSPDFLVLKINELGENEKIISK